MTPAWRSGLHLALLAGASGLALPVLAAEPERPGEAAPTFTPPVGRPMLLSRTLIRELADGKAIVVTRRYRVEFRRAASGWTVDGLLVGSEVEAPPALAPLAELERNRPDDGLFPIALDAAGTILPRAAVAPGPRQGAAAVEQAIALAARRFEAAGPDASRARFIQEVQALAAAGAMTRWPPELFRPDRSRTREEQRYPLPDGSEGIVVIELARDPDASAATMAACERRIITEVSGSRRVAREQWTLAPFEQVATR